MHLYGTKSFAWQSYWPIVRPWDWGLNKLQWHGPIEEDRRDGTPTSTLSSTLTKSTSNAIRLAKANGFSQSCLRERLGWAEEAGSGCDGLKTHKTGAADWVQQRPWLRLFPDICAWEGINKWRKTEGVFETLFIHYRAFVPDGGKFGGICIHFGSGHSLRTVTSAASRGLRMDQMMDGALSLLVWRWRNARSH